MATHTTHAFLIALTLGLAPMASAYAQDESGEAADTQTGGDSEAAEEAQRTEEGEGGERKQRLADRVKAVQRKAFIKKQRIEIYPHFALDLNDPFFQHLIIGGSVGFHLADSFALEARAGFVFASIEQNAIRFVREETDSLLRNPPEFKYHADLDLLWAPLYGKISLFGEGILHFDTYLTAGPGIFGTDAGLNPAGNVGIGQRYFITDWLVARAEIRNYLFIDTRDSGSDIQNLLILGFSLSGFFPTTFEYEYQ